MEAELVGDQLLEVCGINMRSATYQLAANVLRQCGNSITMLVQYSPDKYNELEGSVSSSSEEGPGSHSGSPTPCNSPKIPHKATPLQLEEHTSGLHGVPLSARNTLTRNQIAQVVSTLTRQNATASPDNKSPTHEPRFLFIETRKCSNLGISLVGGNSIGIFVHSVQHGSVAYNSGLRTGDQILEYNNTDLRQATAEEAAYELAKPSDKVTMLARYDIDRYNLDKDKPGDSFYIRSMFDRVGDLGDSLQLRFHKDDVLYVDNTMFNGVPGHWRAWLVDQDGRRTQCGIIPSKYKVEEEMLLRRSLGDIESDARRGTTTARRSFFRRKKHQRSSSRDSKELASFSNINLGWYSDSGTLNEEVALCSYQRVERLDYPVFRPVLVVGPLADCVMEKLMQDFPDKFTRCVPEVMHCSQTVMEKGLAENNFVDFRKKGCNFECTTVNAVKEICDKMSHCILDISLSSVERLHRHQIYPIVLLIKFKSTKQIKEVKDTRYPMEKVSAKAAKEMYEHALKLEAEYKHHISGQFRRLSSRIDPSGRERGVHVHASEGRSGPGAEQDLVGAVREYVTYRRSGVRPRSLAVHLAGVELVLHSEENDGRAAIRQSSECFLNVHLPRTPFGAKCRYVIASQGLEFCLSFRQSTWLERLCNADTEVSSRMSSFQGEEGSRADGPLSDRFPQLGSYLVSAHIEPWRSVDVAQRSAAQRNAGNGHSQRSPRKLCLNHNLMQTYAALPYAVSPTLYCHVLSLLRCTALYCLHCVDCTSTCS
uniref:Uncharacterized protein n=1 Tax=Timema douglasi TaxID=61478 RepID=A0A7R8ZFC8_TIMDO|nr:unnamed protein product [Timema douglasi]